VAKFNLFVPPSHHLARYHYDALLFPNAIINDIFCAR